MNVALGDDTITFSLKFSTERENEYEFSKLWKIRGKRRCSSKNIEEAIPNAIMPYD